MKKQLFLALALFASAAITSSSQAQPLPAIHQVSAAEGHGYAYYTVEGDPLKARVYTLKNGLTVYLTANKNEPRIQTMIAVRAGSKNDPHDATGLAHYLEHMLFKGTDKFGSLDYSKEEPLLNKIDALFETYRATTDADQRAAIYHQIDSISGVAATFAIPNEYDKMLSSLGAKGTNAFTSNEQTVYVNDIPSNQLRKWLTIEGERFRHPVFRLFHTELEAVYEEKNRTLDNDYDQANEVESAELFRKHPYGTQTTIGTVEHLKNPSLRKIKEYFNANYIPNNMGICLSGDIDMDQTIKAIDETFGSLQPKQVPAFSFEQEDPITTPIKRDVYGPDAEFVTIAYRFPGVSSHEARLLTIMDAILSNSSAGLIDLNLNQKQQVLGASSGIDELTDYSIHELSGKPREGQTLEQVADLLLAQVEHIKKGEFDNDLIPAILNDMEIGQMRSYESNGARAGAFMRSFTTYQDWQHAVNIMNELHHITKQEIVDFANKYYSNNYVEVFKRTGPKQNVVKVKKPAITPVPMNRGVESAFVTTVLKTPAEKIAPRFLDYNKDVMQLKLKSGVPFYYHQNEENDLFTMSYVIDIGKKDDLKLGLATGYLNYLGTDKHTAEEIKKQFYALGTDYSINVGDEETTISLSGLAKNFNSSVALLEEILHHAKPDQEALAKLVDGAVKSRVDLKKSKNAILFNAMMNYGLYGDRNPFKTTLSNADLKAITSNELMERLNKLPNLDHHILYYGPTPASSVIATLDKEHPAGTMTIPTKAPRYSYRDMSKNKIYFVNYDMAQAEVLMLANAMPYAEKTEPVTRLYNEYFGGSMASVVFQTIRESKALAYAVRSTINTPAHADESDYISSYVGTQADKLPETMRSMFELMNDMPRSDNSFEQAKAAIQNKIETERITRSGILASFERAKKWHFDHDVRKDVYENVPQMTFDQVAAFQKQNVKDKPYTILVLGSRDKIDMNNLKQYGEVEELSLDQLFGY